MGGASHTQTKIWGKDGPGMRLMEGYIMLGNVHGVMFLNLFLARLSGREAIIHSRPASLGSKHWREICRDVRSAR